MSEMLLQQVKISKSELKGVHELFNTTIESLEKYIEVVGYYPDWKKRKQIKNKKRGEIGVCRSNNNQVTSNHLQRETEELKRERMEKPKRTKITKPISSQENAKNCLSIALFNLNYGLRDKPNFFREELKQEFHQWIKVAGIDISNCHPELRHFLLLFDKVLLEGEEGFKELRDIDNSRKFTSLFASIQTPLNEESTIFSTRTNSQIIHDVKTNPWNWRVDEIPTEFDSFGRVKKQELALIHRNAHEDDYDQKGNLNFNENPIYRTNRFNQLEIEKINKSLNIISQQNSLASAIKNSDENKNRFGNWYCNHCKSYQDSWAENQFHKPSETYRRDIRCWSCNNHSLIYTDSQKSKYKELVKEKTSILGFVEEVEKFSTWWSNNIATAVVYYYGYYRVFLLVYDSVYSTYRPAVFPESYDCNCWGERSRGKFSSLSSAKDEANWLKEELTKTNGKYVDNPILLIHPYCDTYRSYYNYASSPHVVREEVGNSESTYIIPITILHSDISIPSNLNNHFRPLDIIKVKEVHKFWGVRYYHFGVYLGDGEICHFLRKSNGVRKTDWKGFLEDQVGELYKYHTIIPFKQCDKISRQIAYSIENKFREDCYNLYNRNCEHFANMVGLGINYSEQIEDERGLILFKEGAKAAAASSAIAASSIALTPFTFGLSLTALPVAIAPIAEGPPTLNNGKGSTIKLVNEINETKDMLGYTNYYHSQAKEIRERYLQEVPPKEYCRIM